MVNFQVFIKTIHTAAVAAALSSTLDDPVLEGCSVRNHLIQVVPDQQFFASHHFELFRQIDVVSEKQQFGQFVEGRTELN